jgi:glycerate 2-kinase
MTLSSNHLNAIRVRASVSDLDQPRIRARSIVVDTDDVPAVTNGQSLRADGLRIFRESLVACSVERAFLSQLTLITEDGSKVLRLGGETEREIDEIDLAGVRRVVVIAMGKVAANMLNVLVRKSSLVAGCEISGVLVAPSPPADLPEGIVYFAGGHPYPNEQSFAGADAARRLLLSAAVGERASETFIFFLVSGGASAMMELPLDPAISLEDTIQFHRALVHSGASIAEINCVRKHFSAIKGGRLGLAAGSIPSLTIAVSDVPKGRLDALASGPTLPDLSTVEQCRAILAKYSLLTQFPRAVRAFFDSPLQIETPKPGIIPGRVYCLLSSDDLAEAARRSAEALGYTCFVDNTCDDWDYRDASDYLLERLRALRSQHERVCLISVGEVTVKLPEDSHAEESPHGLGGRNTHFALYSATRLEASESISVLSAGSDGVDGNCVAAGAIVDESTVRQRAEEAARALQGFDSFQYLDEAGATIITGPTGNNLRDIRILLADRAS